METALKDDIPVSEEPVQVTDQTLSQDEPTRVLEPEIQEDRTLEQQPVIPLFDLNKLSYELQQGYRIYVELLADSNRNVTWPFLDPVDADALGLWDYYDRIKQPMCFATIGSKFTEYKYDSITEVVADMRLILENCYRYNGPDHWVSKLGQKLEKILEQKLALLNRSLRDKVTLLATMSLNQDLPLAAEVEASGRRRSSRQNYLSMVNGENSSSLVNHVKIQEESVEKERRKQREKEKKVANQALLQDLVDWEEKELTPEIMNQLHSMWEIPSIGSFLYLVRNILGLEDINLTEFELSFIYPNKSSLLARIFTALLVTPHQRKSLYKKPVMTFKRWESKLKHKLDVWYKVAEKEGLYAVSLQYGIDLRCFDILGIEKNPLEEKSYLDLTLYQRVWMLKTLCDVCFHKDYDLRERVNSCDFMEQRELFLGNDAENRSYIYFPVFQTTDIRVYQHDQLEVPKLNMKSRKEPSPPPPSPQPPPPERKKARKTPSKPSTPARPGRPSRLRQLRDDTTPEENEIKEESQPNPEPEEDKEMESKPDSLPAFEAEDGFKLACHDIETLKALCERFARPPTPSKKRGRRPKVPPPRKPCEVELHETLLALLQELEKYEGAFSKNYTKARIKIMKESLEPEAVEPEEPEETPEPEPMEEWGSELSDEDDGAKQDAKDEDFRIEDEFGVTLNLDDKQSKLDNEMQSTSDESSENGSIKAMHRNCPRYKRKRKSSKTEDNAENCSVALQTPNPRFKKKAKKWSPIRETVLPRSVSSPSVVISAVSAEESVKAASMPQKDVKKLSTEAGDEPRSMSPKTILVNSLGEALKRATTSPVKPSNSVANSSVVNITDTSIQGPANTDVTSTVDSSSLLAQNLRKRILVSPEGKAHEVKPCVTSTTTPVITPQERPLVQRKTAVTKGEIAKSVAGTTLVTLSRTIGMLSQNRVMISTGTAPTTVTSTTGSHQRPNILSHSRKQVVGKPGVVAQVTTGNPVQGNTLIPTCAGSHNHTYAVSSTSVNQGSQQSSGVVAPTSTTTVRMVQIIPNSKQTNIQTASSLLASSVMPGTGSNVTTKTGATSGPSGVKVTLPKTPQGVTAKGLLSKPQTLTSAQVSASASPQSAETSKGAASIAVKTQAAKQTPSQTKVVFIPASSVDAKSPLASFKPQTLTTTSGQSIYGYAVVVPPGTPEEVNAVISSALRKPTSVPVKPSSTPMQQKQQVTAPGKVTNQVGIPGKAQNTSLGTSTLPGSKPRPSVGNIAQPRPGATTYTIQPRLGVTVNAAQPRPGAASGATQPRPGVSTTTAQPRPSVPISTTQSRPGVPTNIAQLRPTVTMKTTKLFGVPTVELQPRLSTPIKISQPRPGVSTVTTQPRSGVPTIAKLPRPGVLTGISQVRPSVPVNTTQPRPGVPTTTAQVCPAVPMNTNQPRSGVQTFATQPVRSVPTTTTHLGPSVPVSVVHVLVGSNTKQSVLNVSASFTPNTNKALGSGSAQSSSSVETSTVQPRTGASTNQSSTATSNSNMLLGKSTLASSFGTACQNPTTINVIASNFSKDLPSSSTIRGDAVIKSIEVTTTSSIAQNTTISIPRTASVALSTKVTDSAPTGEQNGRLNALGNDQKSCQTPAINNTNENNSQMKNDPVNHLNVSSTSSEPENVSGSSTSRNFATEISTRNVSKEALSSPITSAITASPSENDKLPLSDKLIAKDEDQKISSYCNGLSVHPTLKSIDSIRNIKCLESATPLEVLNSKAPSLCSTTIHSPTVTSN